MSSEDKLGWTIPVIGILLIIVMGVFLFIAVCGIRG